MFRVMILYPLLQAATGEVKISWRLRGSALMNLLISLCISPANHRCMSLFERCETALTGFVLIDMFGLLAQVTCKKLQWAKGSTWMAPQTANNLQQVALGIVSVAVSKSKFGDPWVGTNRMNEISVEEHFGRIRMTSPNAQVTARSYWRAVARELFCRRDKVLNNQPLEELPPLTDEEFQTAADNAFASALKLASQCSDVQESHLEQMYRDAAAGFGLDIGSLQSLAPNPLEADEQEMMDLDHDEPAPVAEETEALFKTMQQDASSLDFAVEGEEVAETDQTASAQQESFDDVRDPQDKVWIQDVTAASQDDGPNQVSMTKLPTTLRQALIAVENGRPFWDTIWKLILFMRHGFLGFESEGF